MHSLEGIFVRYTSVPRLGAWKMMFGTLLLCCRSPPFQHTASALLPLNNTPSPGTRPPEQYESRIRAMEAEREAMAAAASRSAEVERYKELLLKQRDIMIALTARLNERDDNIVALQVGGRGLGGDLMGRGAGVQTWHGEQVETVLRHAKVTQQSARVSCHGNELKHGNECSLATMRTRINNATPPFRQSGTTSGTSWTLQP